MVSVTQQRSYTIDQYVYFLFNVWHFCYKNSQYEKSTFMKLNYNYNNNNAHRYLYLFVIVSFLPSVLWCYWLGNKGHTSVSNPFWDTVTPVNVNGQGTVRIIKCLWRVSDCPVRMSGIRMTQDWLPQVYLEMAVKRFVCVWVCVAYEIIITLKQSLFWLKNILIFNVL